ncbi:hypothetical protein EMCRGX_G001049 [Ephydatia muelleri]
MQAICQEGKATISSGKGCPEKYKGRFQTAWCAGTSHDVCTAAKNKARAKLRSDRKIPAACHAFINSNDPCKICRLAYELMQPLHTDASRLFHSLDDVYYYGGQQEHRVRAIASHTSTYSGELSMNAGDQLGIAGNEKDGRSVGTHVQSARRGDFPSYKLEEEIIVADFPTYLEVQ